MYNLNTREGKEARIEDIKSLIAKLGSVPGNILSYDEVHRIQEYLVECKADLSKQLKNMSVKI